MSTNTLYDIVQQKHDTHSAVVIPGGPELSFAAFRQQILRVTDQLVAYGITAGDRLSSALVNGLEYATVFLGTTFARAVAAPLNPNYTVEEFLFYLEDTQSKAMIVPKNGGAVAREAARQMGVPIWEVWFDGKNVQLQATSDVPILRTVVPVTPLPSDVALILHTSGTTSRPKAVPLNHGNLMTSVRNIAKTYHLDSSYRSYIVMPLFHVHGLIGAMLSTLYTGGSVVIPPKFSASSFWSEFVRYDCNWYSAVPTIHQILLQHEHKNGKPASRGRLSFVRSCSSSLAAATFHELESTFGVPVIEAYAMTEASHQMTANNMPVDGKRKPGSVGVGKGVQVAILDDEGKAVPQGKEGEVCIKGANVTAGYLNNPAANASSFHKNGFFRTGDQGFMDTDGFLFLTGRLKELINRGGEKISPLEIDSVMLHHPQVAEAIAFGVEDKMYGQEVHAAVVPKDLKLLKDPVALKKLEEDIRQFALKKLASFKVPKKVFFNGTLPRTATGKIQRRHVAAFFAQPKSKL